MVLALPPSPLGQKTRAHVVHTNQPRFSPAVTSSIWRVMVFEFLEGVGPDRQALRLFPALKAKAANRESGYGVRGPNYSLIPLMCHIDPEPQGRPVSKG